MAADGIWLPRWAQIITVAIDAIPAKSAAGLAANVVGDVHVVFPLPTPIAPVPAESAHVNAKGDAVPPTANFTDSCQNGYGHRGVHNFTISYPRAGISMQYPI